MDLDKIQRLIEIVSDSGMAEVKVEEGDFKLTVRAKGAERATQMVQAAPMMQAAPPAVAPAAAPVVPAAPAEPGSGAGEELVRAPIVGTFYSASGPEEPEFVSVGDRVEVGQTLCIIEAMKLMNEIQSEVAGTVTEILVQNATPVEFDQPLFVVAA